MLRLTLLPGERLYILGHLVIEYVLEDGDLQKPIWKIAPYTADVPVICSDLATLPGAKMLPITVRVPERLRDEVTVVCTGFARNGAIWIGVDAPITIRVHKEQRLIQQARAASAVPLIIKKDGEDVARVP